MSDFQHRNRSNEQKAKDLKRAEIRNPDAKAKPIEKPNLIKNDKSSDAKAKPIEKPDLIKNDKERAQSPIQKPIDVHESKSNDHLQAQMHDMPKTEAENQSFDNERSDYTNKSHDRLRAEILNWIKSPDVQKSLKDNGAKFQLAYDVPGPAIYDT